MWDGRRVHVRARAPADEPAVRAFLTAWHSLRVARAGEVLHPLEHPALVAEHEGALAGVLTYGIAGGACEVLTLHATELRTGAVDASRATLKPEIPLVGEHGIPLRDEIVFERRLR
jgi:hypothetical protein